MRDPAALRELLRPLGEVELVLSRNSDHARREAERATRRGAGLVVAGGGDGTVNSVVNGILGGGGTAALGVLPLGTANDFAWSLGLPLDAQRAVGVIASGHRRRVDVVSVESRIRRVFANVAVGGLGPAPEVGDGAAKSTWGRLSYFLDAAEEMARKTPHRVIVDWDHGRVEADVLALVLANGHSSGGHVPVAPHARLDDGLLEVVLIPALGPVELAALAPRILVGQHLRAREVVARRTRQVRIHADPPMRFRLDGEDCGEDDPRARVIPAALEVAAARPRSGR